MPNRILRDWTDSYRIDQLSPQAEIFFTRLIMKVDDFGRFYADPRRLRSACYPLKDSIRDSDITRWLAECEKAGLIVCYETTGCRYLCILRFNQRLRVKHERFPRPPDGHMSDICQSDDCHMPAPFVSVSDSDSRNGEGDARGRGFPATADEALRQCSMLNIPPDFVTHCFEKGNSRGGKDARDISIVNFQSYVTIEWKYERDKIGRGVPGSSGQKGFDRNKGTLNEGHSKDYDLKAIQARRAVSNAQRPAT